MTPHEQAETRKCERCGRKQYLTLSGKYAHIHTESYACQDHDVEAYSKAVR